MVDGAFGGKVDAGQGLLDERDGKVAAVDPEPADEVSGLVHAVDLDLDLALQAVLLGELERLVAERLAGHDAALGVGPTAGARARDAGQQERHQTRLARNVQPQPRARRHKLHHRLRAAGALQEREELLRLGQVLSTSAETTNKQTYKHTSTIASQDPAILILIGSLGPGVL